MACKSLYRYTGCRGSLIKKVFQKAGITDALSMDYLMNKNPFDEDDIRH